VTPLDWTAWPARDEWPRSLLLTLLPAAVVALSFVGYGHYGWIAIAVLSLVLGPYYLPTRYSLDADTLVTRFAGTTRRRPLSRFRRYYPHRIGVHLSPFESPSPLDPFRGAFLRFRGNRDDVLARLEAAGLRKGAKRGAPAKQDGPGSEAGPAA
jgi:hypothetical protein